MDPINLSMVRGDTGEFQVTFSDNTGAPINDPTAEYRMTAKVFDTDPDPGVFSVVAFQYAPGIAILTIPPSDTSGLGPTGIIVSLCYDIQVTETGGRVTTIQFGRLIIQPDISLTTP